MNAGWWVITTNYKSRSKNAIDSNWPYIAYGEGYFFLSRADAERRFNRLFKRWPGRYQIRFVNDETPDPQ